MRKKRLIFIVQILCLALSAPFLKKFCYDRTDGFALYKIFSTLTFSPEWERPASSESTELDKILSQPFHYLARGAQSFVFVAEDGETVLKFFRLSSMRLPKWMTWVSFPLPLEPFRLKKLMEKRRALDKDFQSYKIAFENLKDETGLIYLHLNKTNHLKKRLKFYDKLGIGYGIDLDDMHFLVQKKAQLFYPAIDTLMKNGGWLPPSKRLAIYYNFSPTAARKEFLTKILISILILVFWAAPLFKLTLGDFATMHKGATQKFIEMTSFASQTIFASG